MRCQAPKKGTQISQMDASARPQAAAGICGIGEICVGSCLCEIGEIGVGFCHSARSAVTGSVDAARRAGRKHASSDTTINSSGTIAKVAGSYHCVS
jgi:hypothetical protein